MLKLSASDRLANLNSQEDLSLVKLPFRRSLHFFSADLVDFLPAYISKRPPVEEKQKTGNEEKKHEREREKKIKRGKEA